MTNAVFAHNQSGKISDTQAEHQRNNIEVTGIEVRKEVKLRKDGQPKKTHSNKAENISSMVEPFKNKEDIAAIWDVLDNAILKAEENYRNGIDDTDLYVYKAYRNKLYFKIGMNNGLRISDLSRLKYSDFIVKNGKEYDFIDGTRIKPKKTEKTGKFVDLDYNNATMIAFRDFYKRFPMECEEDLDKYLFTASNKNNATPLTGAQAWSIIKQVTEKAGLKGNFGTHSLRKTYGYHHWHDAVDKTKALDMLNYKYGHTSIQCTLRYIGITREEEKDFANEINL